MRSATRLLIIAVVALSVSGATAAWAQDEGEEDRSGPVVTIPLSGDARGVSLVAVDTEPKPATLGQELTIAGALSGVEQSMMAAVRLGDTTLGSVLIDPDGRFEHVVTVPEDVVPGNLPLSLDFGGVDGVIPLGLLAVVAPTGIDLSGALPGDPGDVPATAATDENPAGGSVPPVVESEAGAPDAQPIDAPDASESSGPPWVLGVAVALVAILGLLLASAIGRRHRRRIPDEGRVVFKGGRIEPVAAGAVHASAAPGTHRTEDVTRTIDLRVETGGTFEVIEMTEWVNASGHAERVLARTDAMRLAQDIVRTERSCHQPSSAYEETWWVVRLISTGATVWMMHLWSEEEITIDGTGALARGHG